MITFKIKTPNSHLLGANDLFKLYSDEYLSLDCARIGLKSLTEKFKILVEKNTINYFCLNTYVSPEEDFIQLAFQTPDSLIIIKDFYLIASKHVSLKDEIISCGKNNCFK